MTVLVMMVALLTIGGLSCDKKKSKSNVKSIKSAGPNLQTLADWPFNADELLPVTFDTANIKRVDSVRVVRVNGMNDYLGKWSDDYISYNCAGVAATKYDVDGVPVYVEIAQCAESQDAYGLYASRRPVGVPITPPGTESFTVGTTRYFTHSEYVVTLSTEKESDSTAVNTLAQSIDNGIELRPGMPTFFILFPYRYRVAASAHYYAYNFLDIPNFNQVFTIDYLTHGDTATLFLAPDESGEQYLSLRAYVKNSGGSSEVPSTILFEGGHGVSFEHPNGKRIIAGLARGKVVGIVGSKGLPEETLLSKWVEGLLK